MSTVKLAKTEATNSVSVHQLGADEANFVGLVINNQLFEMSNEQAEEVANKLLNAVIQNEFAPHIDILDTHPRAKKLLMDAGVIR